MKTIELNNINTNKLHDELIQAGIIPLSVESVVHDNPIKPQSWFTIDDSQEIAFMQIVSQHDPTPKPPLPTQDDYLLDLDYRISLIELGL